MVAWFGSVAFLEDNLNPANSFSIVVTPMLSSLVLCLSILLVLSSDPVDLLSLFFLTLKKRFMIFDDFSLQGSQQMSIGIPLPYLIEVDIFQPDQ